MSELWSEQEHGEAWIDDDERAHLAHALDDESDEELADDSGWEDVYLRD